MKKIISLSLVLIPSFVFAQFSKGQVFLGGTLSTLLSNSGTPGTMSTNYYGSNGKNNYVSISPIVGFFINQKIAVGGSIGYLSNYRESNFYTGYYDSNGNFIYVPAFSKSITNSISLNAFARYYFPISNSFYFALQGQTSFTRGYSKNTSFNNGNTLSQEFTSSSPFYSLGTTINPVFIFFPSSRWGIETGIGSLGYFYQRNLPNVSSNSGLSLNAGSFSFGLAYYFAKK